MSMHRDTITGTGGVEPTSLFDLPGTAVALARAGEVFGQRCGEWQREMLSFVSNRVKADIELPAALAGCRDAAEIAKIQQQWIEAATQAYLDEGGRLAEIGAAAVQDGMANWLAAFRETAEEATSVAEATVGDYTPSVTEPDRPQAA